MNKKFDKQNLKLNDIVTFECGMKGILRDFEGDKCFETVYDGANYYFISLEYCDQDYPCRALGGSYNIEKVQRPDCLNQLYRENWNKAPVIWDKFEKEEKIIVTRHNRRTVAKYIVSGETVEKASSCCHRDDKYDFMKGSDLAMKRLNKKICDHKYKCFLNCDKDLFKYDEDWAIFTPFNFKIEI